jgi:hypothetical protein
MGFCDEGGPAEAVGRAVDASADEPVVEGAVAPEAGGATGRPASRATTAITATRAVPIAAIRS